MGRVAYRVESFIRRGIQLERIGQELARDGIVRVLRVDQRCDVGRYRDRINPRHLIGRIRIVAKPGPDERIPGA